MIICLEYIPLNICVAPPFYERRPTEVSVLSLCSVHDVRYKLSLAKIFLFPFPVIFVYKVT